MVGDGSRRTLTHNDTNQKLLIVLLARRYFYDTRRAPFDYERPYACKWEFKSLTTRITYIGDGTTDSTETTTVTADGGAINAHGYQIRFQATDTLTPSSASVRD